MSHRKFILILLLLLILLLTLTACQAAAGDPYDAGQTFRQTFDRFIEDASQFLAGFCGLPQAALLGAAGIILSRRFR